MSNANSFTTMDVPQGATLDKLPSAELVKILDRTDYIRQALMQELTRRVLAR